MKEKRLLNELGNVNDDFIEQAKPKIKNNRKKLYAVIGSVAATAAVFVAVFATGNGLLKMPIMISTIHHQQSQTNQQTKQQLWRTAILIFII